MATSEGSDGAHGLGLSACCNRSADRYDSAVAAAVARAGMSRMGFALGGRDRKSRVMLLLWLRRPIRQPAKVSMCEGCDSAVSLAGSPSPQPSSICDRYWRNGATNRLQFQFDPARAASRGKPCDEICSEICPSSARVLACLSALCDWRSDRSAFIALHHHLYSFRPHHSTSCAARVLSALSGWIEQLEPECRSTGL